jgi:hypothetical protein
MVLIRGDLSLNSPTAMGKFRNRANSINGSFCDIVFTRVTKPVQIIHTDGGLNVNHEFINEIYKTTESTPRTPEKREKPEIPMERNEKLINALLGRLVYTTKDGDTFEAYHSNVFPKIVYEGVVYNDKDSWRAAMLCVVVEPRRLN